MEANDYQELKAKLSDRTWRLNNLYWITDKQGKKIKFKLNWAQQHLYKNLHFFNVILKARQLGFTTFIMIYFLDACLFNKNHKAGVIAHTREDAQDLFDNKIRFAYDNLPESLKTQLKATTDSARKLTLSNGSSIVVGVSLRSGTFQKLLVSEYGKISAKYPDKAKEIKTGALNTVDAGQQIFIESTAEGKAGEFYVLCEWARKLKDGMKELARLEPKFFFFPWFKNPLYVANDNEVGNIRISDKDKEYFETLEEDGITLTEKQKVWYVIKRNQQGEDMTQEYPSAPEEAFQGSLQGAFYTEEMKHVRNNGQICYLPYNSKYKVYTWWDLGTNDLMTCWFYQKINGKHCFIDYFEDSNEGWDYYAKILSGKGYNYARHNFPHDGNKRMRGKQLFTDKQCAIDVGISPIKITPRTSNTYNDIINFCKPVLKNCWFDEEKCATGILHLDNYRKKWNKQDSMFMKEPQHDEASHGSDSFRTFAVNAEKIGETKKKVIKKDTYVPRRSGWQG